MRRSRLRSNQGIDGTDGNGDGELVTVRDLLRRIVIRLIRGSPVKVRKGVVHIRSGAGRTIVATRARIRLTWIAVAPITLDGRIIALEGCIASHGLSSAREPKAEVDGT